jgi:hypothetical protein
MSTAAEQFRRAERRRLAGAAKPLAHPLGTGAAPYPHPYACFACRSSFKRAGADDDHVLPCVRCKAPSVRLSRKFKPPPRSNIDQWRKAQALVRAGFLFESVSEAYPDRLNEVADFARRLAPHLAERRARWPRLYAAVAEAMSGRP